MLSIKMLTNITTFVFTFPSISTIYMNWSLSVFCNTDKNTSIAQDFHHGVHFEVKDEKNQQNHILNAR